MLGIYAYADNPPTASIEVKKLDKLLYDTLREVHNRGAEMYNRGDAVACYRIYQGSLWTIRPLLTHRPQQQKWLDEEMARIDKEPSIARRAFRLHEVIEQVRTDLRASFLMVEEKSNVSPPSTNEPRELAPPPMPLPTPGPMPTPKTDPKSDPKPQPQPDPKVPAKSEPKAEPMPKADAQPLPQPPVKGKDQPKPPPPAAPQPPPMPKTEPRPQPTPPPAVTPATEPAKGIVVVLSLQGKPLSSATIVLHELADRNPRSFTGKTDAEGQVLLPQVPPGKYRVTVSRLAPSRDQAGMVVEAVPARYTQATTTPLFLEVSGNQKLDVRFDVQ